MSCWLGLGWFQHWLLTTLSCEVVKVFYPGLRMWMHRVDHEKYGQCCCYAPWMYIILLLGVTLLTRRSVDAISCQCVECLVLRTWHSVEG